MNFRHWITAISLLVLMALAVAGLVRTREQRQPAQAETLGKKSRPQNAGSEQQALVDLRPLQTARRIAAMAAAPEEQRFAHEAEKVADHEVDLAFFDALRTAEENPPQLTPAARQTLERKTNAEQAVKDDQENIAKLTRKLAPAPEAQKENLQDQIDVARAQMELDQDEFDDASEDLDQSGTDAQAKIKRLKEQHEAGGHGDAQVASAVNPHEQEYQARTFLSVFRAWRALGEKAAKLEEARQDSLAEQQRLKHQHDALTAKVEQEKESRETAKQQAKGFAQGSKAASREESKTNAKVALDSLKQHARDQKTLADLGRRLQDDQELGDIYANWIAFVRGRQRAALHNMIWSVLWILLIALLVHLASRLIEKLFSGAHAENKRIDTLRAVVKFALQAVGVIAALFLIFGVPDQTTTVIGLAGAGLTVAMKDFIVGFFGWFTLMGRNGIRVGDWVEINGVGGEVIEVGLLKTVLLETGNWTDAGHPTGRRVSFVNSFAIEGHFFNFTTSGQWMWDELAFTVPASQDPYTIIDGLQKLVAKETEGNVRKAEEEWRLTTSRYRVQAFSAAPAINVRPAGSDVEVSLRYITRAYERHETRRRLYQAALELMHGKRQAVSG